MNLTNKFSMNPKRIISTALNFPITKKDTAFAVSSWAARIRTLKCWSQSPVPYHLATAHCFANELYYIRFFSFWQALFSIFLKKFLSGVFLSSLPFFRLCCKLKLPSRGGLLAHGNMISLFPKEDPHDPSGQIFG